MAAHLGDDGFGDLAAVEHLGALLGNLLEGLRKLGVAQGSPHRQRLAVLIQEVTGHGW